MKIISFSENHLGITRLRRGIQIGHLSVHPEFGDYRFWCIYNTISQSRFFSPRLEGEQFAINLAEFFSKVYGDYLLIPRAWKGADVIMLARYSVKYGMRIQAINELNTVLTQSQFVQLFHILV